MEAILELVILSGTLHKHVKSDWFGSKNVARLHSCAVFYIFVQCENKFFMGRLSKKNAKLQY